jgi:hypothetical protein
MWEKENYQTDAELIIISKQTGISIEVLNMYLGLLEENIHSIIKSASVLKEYTLNRETVMYYTSQEEGYFQANYTVKEISYSEVIVKSASARINTQTNEIEPSVSWMRNRKPREDYE